MQNANEFVEQVMQTPFNEAIQSVWVLGALYLAVSYVMGVYQTRRFTSKMMDQNSNRRMYGYERKLTNADKWGAFFIFVLSPVWAPATLISEWAARGAHSFVCGTVNKFLTPPNA